MARSIRKVLVANRGEIACRVIRTCREMGIETVAVYSDADRSALHVRMADEAHRLGPPPSRESYLAGERVLDVARKTRADALHPGYGFLSENAGFAAACADAGVIFIGPSPASMEAMGIKTQARDRMRKAQVPVVPGSPGPVEDEGEALRLAREIGFPVMLKAAAGGGGKGMKRIDREADFAAAFRSARSETKNAFGDDRVYLERYLDEPRHVEIQLFADGHGTTLYLGERECSVQRRHQKVIEETPSPVVDEDMRQRMGQVAVRAAEAVSYVGAGTVEFLVDAKKNFYFLEMNTRLQVEHPVTEWCTGLDLVRWQIEVAAGKALPWQQADVRPRGHAIEARVYAEDPARGFLPSPGRIQQLRVPAGPWVRDDGGVYPGFTVPTHYDPMISKLSVWAPDRPQAIERLRRALSEYVVRGITTNVRWLRRVLDHADFRSGRYDTGFLSLRAVELQTKPDPALEPTALLAAAARAFARDEQRALELSRHRTAESPAWKLAGRTSAFARRGPQR